MVEPQLLVDGLVLSQHVVCRAAGLRDELADLRLGQGVDVIVHTLEVDAALRQKREEVLARRAGGFLVDGQLAHVRSRSSVTSIFGSFQSPGTVFSIFIFASRPLSSTVAN